MSTNVNRSVDDEILGDLEEWCRLHLDSTHWDIEEVAGWIVDRKHYELGRRLIRKEVAKRLSKAQNRKHIRNAQGNRVRMYHAARLPVVGRKKQKVFWAHRVRMDASFAHASFEQRERQAEGFCRSMNNDAKDVNENNPHLKGNPIQLELDFSYVDGERKAAPVQTIPIAEPPAEGDAEKRKRKPR